jgi:hypothetical protein
VRKLALELACEVYRWMADVFLEQVRSMKDLKPAQVKEVGSLRSAGLRACGREWRGDDDKPSPWRTEARCS